MTTLAAARERNVDHIDDDPFGLFAQEGSLLTTPKRDHTRDGLATPPEAQVHSLPGVKVDWPAMERLEQRTLFSVDVGDLQAPMIDDPGGADHHDNAGPAHPDDSDKQPEHNALLDLVPHEAATHIAHEDGLWSDPATWEAGLVPDGLANVLIPDEIDVIYDLLSDDPMHTVRIDGSLQFAHDIDTQLLVDTLIVSSIGTLIIGTENAPVDDDVIASIVIADLGPIDTQWDPIQISRGLISHGEVVMYGEHVTPFVELAEAPRKRDTRIVLAQSPDNWQVGDRIIITGTYTNGKTDEEREIIAINGDTITLNKRLRYHHTVPSEAFSIHVANVSRNIAILSGNPLENDHRGHVMFAHDGLANINNVGFYGLGRTDKRNHIDDPLFDADGELIDGTGMNPRGRYAAHFHHNGATFDDQPAVIRGSAVVDSPGWGFVNHDSYVIMEDNISFDVVGAGFVTEFGNEIGAMRRNIAIRSEGASGKLAGREAIFDFGFNGHGFWLQGGGVALSDNIAVGHRSAGFIFFTRSSEAQFAAENLVNPDWAEGQDFVPVGSVPIVEFSGNTAYASKTGFESWFHLLNFDHEDGRSVVEDFTVFNTRSRAIFTPYTNQMSFLDVHAFGSLSRPRGEGFGRNNATRNMLYQDVRVEGFKTGINMPVRGENVVEGGHFNNIINILITKSQDNLRTINVEGNIEFGTLSESALKGKKQFDLFMQNNLDIRNRDLTKLFSPDIVRLGTVRFQGQQLYYHEQASDGVPFPADLSPDYIPEELIGKTNQEIWDMYGIALGGVVAPEDATTAERVNGLVGSRSEYLPDLRLRSRKYTNQLENYRLSYNDADGNRVRDPDHENLCEGWNLLTREVDGHTRTFFVYGDITAPTFELNPEQPLIINPLVLNQGFTLHGSIHDDSFGTRKFKRKYKGSDLLSQPLQTRDDGSMFILLEFTIRDMAGNRTPVSFELTLDDTAPLNPLGPQKELPPRKMSPTLIALLNQYYRGN